jgi:hypothetical protein
MTRLKRLIAIAGAGALMMGTMVGLSTSVLADDEDTIVGSVSISCPTAASVSLTGEQVDFAPIDITETDETSTEPGAIQLTVDMGCYLGPWQVNAAATKFTSDTTAQWFGANHLSLEDPQVDSYFFDPVDDIYVNLPWPLPDINLPDVAEPDASAAFFECGSTNPNGSCGEEILETSQNLVTFFINLLVPGAYVAMPAPFITEASYTGVLSDIPFLWGEHTYTSTITVELATD